MDNLDIEKDAASTKRARNWKKEMLEWIKSAIFAFIIAYVLTQYIFTFTKVTGSSMYPTLVDGERLIELRCEKYFRDFKRGDIVVIHDNIKTEGKYYVKRIIAVGGDTIAVRDGEVILNGEVLHEDYIGDVAYTEGEVEYTLQEDEFFVLGDNRNRGKSRDSREFGVVTKEMLDGRCVLRVMPFKRFGGLK